MTSKTLVQHGGYADNGVSMSEKQQLSLKSMAITRLLVLAKPENKCRIDLKKVCLLGYLLSTRCA